MRYIDMETWPRRAHFRHFIGLAYPHIGLCAPVDLTAFYPAVKQRGVSFSVAMAYVLARAANAIPEFRCRIRKETVVEHAVVHPSTTVLTGQDLFSFCNIEYTADFSLFTAFAEERIAYVKEHPTLEDESGQDDLLYMTTIPWVSFTSFVHPIDLNPADSIPRFAWGKRFEESGRLRMPLNVQVHHALMDGIHIGRFYEAVQECLQQPGLILD